MPNIERKTTFICQDCEDTILVTDELMSFEHFQKLTGRQDILKPCAQHNKDHKEEKPVVDDPDVILQQTTREKKKEAAILAAHPKKETKETADKKTK